MLNSTLTRRIIQNVGYTACRNYAFKSDLKIKWVRPEKIPCIRPEKSGDLSGLPPVDPTSFPLEFKDSKELLSAEDSVKSIFMLENNKRKITSNLYRTMFVKEVQRHALDYGSTEARLAKMTATIRRFQEHMEMFPRDVRIKVMLKELIDKRKKFLKYLRRWDYRRFEWILEKLDLVYKPPPSEFHWITRKDSLRKLTDIHCDKIRRERLEEYQKKLQTQQEDFLVKKIASLEHIRKEQQECQIPVTVKDEEIKAAKKQLEDLREKMQVLENETKS